MKKCTIMIVVLMATTVCSAHFLNDTFGPGTKTFMSQLVSKPGEVGAFAPSSKYVAHEVTRSIRDRNEKPLRILEVGAGTGIFTRQIIKDAGKTYHLDVIEINLDFCNVLRKEFENNPNVHIHQIDILKWQPEQHYDIIISALPLNIFNEEFLTNLFEKYENMITSGGKIAYIEMKGLINLKTLILPKKDAKLLKSKLALIQNFREKHLEETVTIMRNIPPMNIHHLKM